MELKIHTQTYKYPNVGDIVVLKPVGPIDQKSIQVFEATVLDIFKKGVCKFVLDLSETKYLNSTGLGLLINIAHRVNVVGGGIKLVNVAEKFKVLFDMLGLENCLPIFQDFNLAVKDFGVENPDNYEKINEEKQEKIEENAEENIEEDVEDEEEVRENFTFDGLLMGENIVKEEGEEEKEEKYEEEKEEKYEENKYEEEKYIRKLEREETYENNISIEQQIEENLNVNKHFEGKNIYSSSSIEKERQIGPYIESSELIKEKEKERERIYSPITEEHLQRRKEEVQSNISESPLFVERKTVLQYYNKMEKGKTYPLTFSFIGKEIKKNLKNPKFIIIPHFPGCSIVPTKRVVDIVHPKSVSTFWITPLTKGSIKDKIPAWLDIWYEGKLYFNYNLEFKIVKPIYTLIFAIFTFLSPIIGAIFDYIKLDISNIFPLHIIQHIIRLIGGWKVGGTILGVIFLIITLLCFFKFREEQIYPKEKKSTFRLH